MSAAVRSVKKTRTKGKPRGRPFTPGHGGGPGRPRGLPNKATLEAKQFARIVLEDPVVQAKLLDQAQRGKLAPAVMVMLFHYAYGKPKETVAVEGCLEGLIIRIVDEYADNEVETSAPDASAGKQNGTQRPVHNAVQRSMRTGENAQTTRA